MESDKIFERLAKQTPDGLAYYPRGPWGAGYVVDEALRRRIERYFDWRIYLTIGIFVLAIPTWTPGSPPVKVLAALALWTACNQAILAALLRRARRAGSRLTMDDLAERQAAALSQGRLLVLTLPVIPAAGSLAYFGLFRPPTQWTTQIATMILLALYGYTTLFLYRAIRARKTPHGL